jgi:hypothetical protein
MPAWLVIGWIALFTGLAVIPSKLSATDTSSSAETLGPDDHRGGRTARKLAVPSLFRAILDSAKPGKSGYASEQVQHAGLMKDPHI